MTKDKHPVIRLAFIQSTLFGSGLAKTAPGTCGSILSFLIFTFISSVTGKPNTFLLITIFLLAILISHLCNEICIQNLNELDHKDPQIIVNDEFLGYFMSILFIDWNILNLAIALIIFRIFDITKPGLVSWADKKEGTFSIILDDLIAGLYTAACLIAINFFLN